MPTLFEPLDLGGVRLRNRVFMSTADSQSSTTGWCARAVPLTVRGSHRLRRSRLRTYANDLLRGTSPDISAPNTSRAA